MTDTPSTDARRPLIGIGTQIELRDDDPLSPVVYYLRFQYIELVERYGGTAMLIPPTGNIEAVLQSLSFCDAVLLAGGNDIDPARYGQQPIEGTNPPQPARDDSEIAVVEWCLEHDMPLFGICRGIQMLNVALGGTLSQDTSLRGLGHSHWQDPPYDADVHTVSPLAGTLLAALVGEAPFAVNSIHHQCVDEVAPALRTAALSEDGLVECLYHPQATFAMGVQWHPEFAQLSPQNATIFRAFVDAARRYHALTRKD